MLNRLYDRPMNATLAILRRRIREKKKSDDRAGQKQMKIVAFENLSALIYLVRATPASLIQSGRRARVVRFSLSPNDISTHGFLVFIQ